MNSRLIQDGSTYLLVFEDGDEVIGGLTEFARSAELAGGRLMAVGALQDVKLAYFDIRTNRYRPIALAEQVEVASLLGNVAIVAGEPKVHAHVVVGRSDGTAMAGHLLEGHVRPTLEVFLITSPTPIERRTDARTGLPLIALGETK